MIIAICCILFCVGTAAFAQETMQKNNEMMGKKSDTRSATMARMGTVKDGFIMKKNERNPAT